MVGIIVNLSLCSDLRWYKTSCRATFLRFQNLHSKTNRKVSEFLLGPMEDQGEKKTQQTTCRSFRLLMYSLMMSWPQKLFFVLCFVWDAYSYTIIPGLLTPKVGITGFKKSSFSPALPLSQLFRLHASQVLHCDWCIISSTAIPKKPVKKVHRVVLLRTVASVNNCLIIVAKYE